MDIYEAWEKALKKTEIVRSRAQSLHSFQDTAVPYILLSESSINTGDTVVRRGEVLVEKPTLILPPHLPQFAGFEFDEREPGQENALVSYLLMRGINLPSMKFNNVTYSLDIFEDRLSQAAHYYVDILQHQENVVTGLIIGPEDGWQFSLLFYICGQIARNADTDIKNLMREHKKRKL